MKNFFKSLGKAILYLLAYLGIQLIVSSIAGIVFVILALLSGDMEMTTLENDILSYTTVILLISNGLTLLFIWLFFKIREKSIVKEIGLRKCNWKLVLAAVVFGIGFTFGLSGLMEMIPFPDSLVESFTSSHDTLSTGNPIIGFVSVAIFAPVVEEVFFRGLIYTRLKQGMPKVVAAVISALMFGVMHGEVIWILYAFVVGLMLVWVFEKTNSLLACIMVHAANNGLTQLTENAPELPDGLSLAITVVSVIAVIVALVYLIKSGCVKDKEQSELENVNLEELQM